MTDDNNEVFDLDAAVDAAFEKVSEPTEEAPQVPQEISQDTPDQGNVEVAKPAETEQPLEPHSRWSAEDREFFKALPRQQQEFLLRREGDVEKHITQKTQEIAEQRKNYEALEQAISPYRQMMAQHGGEAQTIQQLLQLNQFANTDPVGFIKWIAKDRGVDLGTFMAGEEDSSDPAIVAYQKRVETLEQKLNARDEAENQTRINSVKQELDAFKGEKDANGNPLRPYFDDVRVEMAAFMKNGVAKDLHDAYDRAIYANPSIRQQILAQQRQADEKDRLNAAKEAAAKAEKATGVQVKTKTPAKPALPKGDWEDTLADVADRLMGA